MTKERKEAIERIITYIQFKCRGEDLEALNTAIQALKQEPINVVLDKIKTETEDAYEDLDGYDPDALPTYADRVSRIIDKYKTENEEK